MRVRVQLDAWHNGNNDSMVEWQSRHRCTECRARYVYASMTDGQGVPALPPKPYPSQSQSEHNAASLAKGQQPRCSAYERTQGMPGACPCIPFAPAGRGRHPSPLPAEVRRALLKHRPACALCAAAGAGAPRAASAKRPPARRGPGCIRRPCCRRRRRRRRARGAPRSLASRSAHAGTHAQPAGAPCPGAARGGRGLQRRQRRVRAARGIAHVAGVPRARLRDARLRLPAALGFGEMVQASRTRSMAPAMQRDGVPDAAAQKVHVQTRASSQGRALQSLRACGRAPAPCLRPMTMQELRWLAHACQERVPPAARSGTPQARRPRRPAHRRAPRRRSRRCPAAAGSPRRRSAAPSAASRPPVSPSDCAVTAHRNLQHGRAGQLGLHAPGGREAQQGAFAPCGQRPLYRTWAC